MNKKRLLLLLFVTPLLLTSCSSNKEVVQEVNAERIVYQNGDVVYADEPSIDGSLKGTTVAILPQSWMDYYSDLSDYRNININDCWTPGVEDTKPVPVSLSWDIDDAANYYLVFCSTKMNMSNALSVFSVTASFPEYLHLDF